MMNLPRLGSRLLSKKTVLPSKFLRFSSATTDVKPIAEEFFDRELLFDQQVVRLVLRSPKRRNALSLEMMEKLTKELREIDSIQKLRAVIIAAEGPAFSAGHDLRELTSSSTPSEHRNIFKRCTELMQQIQQMQLPVIAEVDGVAAAAGCQLVAQCDLAVASERSTFSVPGLKAGLFCSTPGIPLVRNVSRKTAMDMLLTARTLSAQEALAVGLISRVAIAPDTAASEAMKMAEQILSMSRSVIALGKAFFYSQVELDQNAAYRQGEAVMCANLKLRDCQEGIAAFIEKRKANWAHGNEKA